MPTRINLPLFLKERSMSRSRLLSVVARITGDTRATINRLGFGLDRGVERPQPIRDDPLTMFDCPCCGNPIILASDNKTPLPAFAECHRCESIVHYEAHEVYRSHIDDVIVAPERDVTADSGYL